eukprot:5091046-Karenia_brevis.AAC.1
MRSIGVEVTRRKSDFFCKQCCQYAESLDRDDLKEVDTVNKKMTIARTVQQRLAGQLFDEQVLTKEELSNML